MSHSSTVSIQLYPSLLSLKDLTSTRSIIKRSNGSFTWIKIILSLFLRGSLHKHALHDLTYSCTNSCGIPQNLSLTASHSFFIPKCPGKCKFFNSISAISFSAGKEIYLRVFPSLLRYNKSLIKVNFSALALKLRF